MGTIFLIGLAAFILGAIGAAVLGGGQRDYGGAVIPGSGSRAGIPCLFICLTGLATVCVTGWLYFRHH